MPKGLVAEVETTIHARADKVWEALTTPALIAQYLFGTHVESNWEVGSPITYKGEWQGKQYEDKGIILELEPEKRFVSTYWSSMSGKPDTEENYSTVIYELTAEDDDATTLKITQDNNATEESREHSEKNWASVLKGLKEMLEK